MSPPVVLADPTTIDILPESAEELAPDPMKTDPELPLTVFPELRTILPLTPLLTPAAVSNVMSPLLDEVPCPVLIVTAPPVSEPLFPAVTVTDPPSLLLLPTTTEMNPPGPLVLSPDAILMAPAVLVADPVLITIAPLFETLVSVAKVISPLSKDAEEPVVMVTEPPVLEVALVDPAVKVIALPLPVFVEPTAIDTFPAAPLIAPPVPMRTSPELPDLLAPLLMAIKPVVSATPVKMAALPDVVALDPDAMRTKPLVVAAVPASTKMLPDSELADDPVVKYIAPDVPAVTPVLNNRAPVALSLAVPDAIVTLPDVCDAPLASPDTMVTAPLVADVESPAAT